MNILIIISFVLLLLTSISLLIGIGNNMRYKLWYFLLSASVLIAYASHILNLTAILFTILTGILAYYYRQKQKPWLAVLYVILSYPLFFHAHFAGFHNYKFIDSLKITSDAVPYSLYFNFDKTLAGIFILGFLDFKIKKQNVRKLVEQYWKHMIVMFIVLSTMSYFLRYVHSDIKWPSFTPIWILVNLFFVCMAEEVLCRRVIQHQLASVLKIKYGNYIAIFISAVIFGLIHYQGGIKYILLASLAGLFYGHIYDKTKEIRSSILLHFSLNIIHFLFFTYPVLFSSH